MPAHSGSVLLPAVLPVSLLRSLVPTARSVHKVPAPEPLDVASHTAGILFSGRWQASTALQLSSQHSPFSYSTTRVQRRQLTVSSVAKRLSPATSHLPLPMTLFLSSSGTRRSPLLQFTGQLQSVASNFTAVCKLISSSPIRRDVSHFPPQLVFVARQNQ